MSTLEPKHPGLRLALRIALGVLVIGSFAFAIAHEAEHIGSIEWRFRPGWLVLCLLALMAFQISHIELWRLMMSALGRPLPEAKARAIWSTTLLARYVPTSALMAVGRVAMSEREGVPKRITLASIVYELAFTVIAAVSICVYLLWRLPALDDDQWVCWLATVFPVAGLVALHPAIFHRVTDHVLVRLGRAKLPLSLPFGRVFEFTVLYIGSFVIAGVAVLAMAHALHDLDAGDTYAAVASYGLGYVAGVVGFLIPGALGAREAGVALGLSVVLPTAVAVAVAIAVRLVQMGVELLFAGLTPVVARSAGDGR